MIQRVRELVTERVTFRNATNLKTKFLLNVEYRYWEVTLEFRHKNTLLEKVRPISNNASRTRPFYVCTKCKPSTFK